MDTKSSFKKIRMALLLFFFIGYGAEVVQARTPVACKTQGAAILTDGSGIAAMLSNGRDRQPGFRGSFWAFRTLVLDNINAQCQEMGVLIPGTNQPLTVTDGMLGQMFREAVREPIHGRIKTWGYDPSNLNTMIELPGGRPPYQNEYGLFWKQKNAAGKLTGVVIALMSCTCYNPFRYEVLSPTEEKIPTGPKPAHDSSQGQHININVNVNMAGSEAPASTGSGTASGPGGDENYTLSGYAPQQVYYQPAPQYVQHVQRRPQWSWTRVGEGILANAAWDGIKWVGNVLIKGKGYHDPYRYQQPRFRRQQVVYLPPGRYPHHHQDHHHWSGRQKDNGGGGGDSTNRGHRPNLPPTYGAN